MRDRVCRDTRQVAAIAYNDTRKLTEQLVYLERNTLAIEKARDAPAFEAWLQTLETILHLTPNLRGRA